MGLFEIPDPVSMFESAKNAGLEREVAVELISASISSAITFAWASGSAKWADWTGEGQALKDGATVAYLTLSEKIIDGSKLTITVPKALLDPNNLARFQTQEKKK